jgi:hypothetical protein
MRWTLASKPDLLAKPPGFSSHFNFLPKKNSKEFLHIQDWRARNMSLNSAVLSFWFHQKLLDIALKVISATFLENGFSLRCFSKITLVAQNEVAESEYQVNFAVEIETDS